MESCRKKVLDTAGVVREAMFRQRGMITWRAGTPECDFWLYWAKHPRTEGVHYAPRACPQDRTCTRGTALLRCGLSANSDDEARPRAGNDDEPLRNARGLLGACIPRPVPAPEPYSVHSVVEFCTRRANVDPSIAQYDSSQRTDRVGCVRGDRHSSDRSGSGKEVGGASLCCDGVGQPTSPRGTLSWLYSDNTQIAA